MSGFAPILLIIILGVVGILGYLILNPRISTPSPLPTPTQTPDSAAYWKTYSNAEVGISLKYPESWITESYEIASADLHGVIVLKNRLKSYEPAPGAIGISYWDNSSNFTLEKFEKNHAREAGGIIVYYPEAKTVALTSTTAYYTEKADCHPVLCSKYILPIKNKIFDISVFTETPDDKSTIDQILSTFKFLDGTSKGKGCYYNGVEYKEGERFSAEDGCNTCFCNNGEVACTLIACQ